MAGGIERGDVRLYEFAPPNKKRTMALLTRNGAIGLLSTVTVAPVTSTIRCVPSKVALTEDDGMKVPRVVNLYNVVTVSAHRLGRRVARLGTSRIQMVRWSRLWLFMSANPSGAGRRLWLTASLVLTVLSVCTPVLASPRALPDQIVATPAGNLRITDLKCDHVGGFLGGVLSVQGKIVNETGKSWNALYLAMDFEDKNGTVTPKERPDALILAQDPSASAGLVLNAFDAGATLKLKYQVFTRADRDTFSVKFKFADGRYPPHYQIVLTKPQPASTLEYHDDALAVTFSLQRTEIDFVLKNKSDDPIKLDWNLVSFVGDLGIAQGVIHKGVILANRQASKPASMIPPKAEIVDIIVPVENVEFANGEWLTHALLVDGPAALKMVGEEFSIFMPLDIGGTTKNYTFTFKVVGVN